MTETVPPTFDLSNCEREPIHVLGTIQAFGFLLTVTADWFVSRVSANIGQFLKVTPQSALGQPLTQILSEDAIHAIRNRITMMRGVDAVERLFNLALEKDGALFDVALHFSGSVIVIEAEPAALQEKETAALVRAMIARVAQADSFASFLREGARQVRALTGIDRVMVYRFDEQGSGEVVAEALRPGVDSFLGLHYPASDIPAQARKLYVRNIFRVIADVKDVPVPIIPGLDHKGQALDQSLSVLRSVSPIHIEYLKNMGVGASLSISIIADGKLWGLFACHHYGPHLPSFAHRTAAELFGQMFSLMLESRERREAADYETRARAATDRIMATIAQDNDLLANPQWLGDAIFDTIPADGIGVSLNGAVALSGLTPDPQQFGEVLKLLAGQGNAVFATDSIRVLLPQAASYADRAAGMIAIPLSRHPRDYVVLFRSEQLRSVRWAGNPEKPVEYGPNGARLTPRKSFEAWSELVKHQSVPFTPAERRVAETLRTAILEVLVRLSDSASEERSRADERQQLLIAELNHRVRNILALIRGLISQSRGSAESVAGFVATLDERIRALARAHDQITADHWGPAKLRDLLETETGVYLGDDRTRVALNGPNVLVQPSAFTNLALVFHELTTNAVKYGALSAGGTVSVTWSLDAEGDLLIRWKEQGGPAVVQPTRRGFGTTIIAHSIPYDLGGTADVAYPVSGFTAKYRIPARHIAGLAPQTAAAGHKKIAAPRANPLTGQTVLLVEDSMIIALEAEDALRECGASEVITAATVARALEVIEEGGIAFALLDVNLGEATSAPVAAVLSAKDIPFVFATGYDEGSSVLAGYPEVPVINKPYNCDHIIKAFDRIVAGAPA